MLPVPDPRFDSNEKKRLAVTLLLGIVAGMVLSYGLVLL